MVCPLNAGFAVFSRIAREFSVAEALWRSGFRRAVYSVISKTSISFTVKFGEPVKTVLPFRPLPFTYAQPKEAVQLLVVALQFSETAMSQPLENTGPNRMTPDCWARPFGFKPQFPRREIMRIL
jgi:hypothetical protein